jgi:alpha-L-rhamnosidase
MDILSRNGLKSQLMDEIQDYFYYMAQRTGTLWENVGSEASCNHGFASYIGHVLYRDVLGIRKIDYLKKEVVIEFTNSELKDCSGVIPVDESSVELKWNRVGNQITYSVKTPPGYNVIIDNHSSAEIVRLN